MPGIPWWVYTPLYIPGYTVLAAVVGDTAAAVTGGTGQPRLGGVLPNEQLVTEALPSYTRFTVGRC